MGVYNDADGGPVVPPEHEPLQQYLLARDRCAARNTMMEGPVDRQEPPEAGWPHLKPPSWWLGLASVIIALALLIAPGLTELTLWIRVLAGICLVALALSRAILRFGWQAGSTLISRIRWYGMLYKAVQDERQKADEMKDALAPIAKFAALAQAIPHFDITGVVPRGNQVDLLLSGRKSPVLTPGDVVMVIDSREFDMLGRFRIVGPQGSGYTASPERILDGLWWGAMYQFAIARKTGSPTEAIAILIG